MIQGKSWELKKGLSPGAEENLDEAVRFLSDRLADQANDITSAIVRARRSRAYSL